MENIKMEDIVEKTPSPSEEAQVEEQVETEATVETETEVETEQDPLKTELERVQRKSTKTPVEKLLYTKARVEKQLKELGVDEEGYNSEIDEDDTPLTVGMLKKLQAEGAAKTALQQANEIKNETERELVKFHLQNTIKSTGLPNEDLKLARALVNAVKNTQIIQEQTRKTPPKTHSNSSGVDAKHEKEIVYTAEELAFMRPPFNNTPAQILAARQGKTFDFKHAKK
jgi:hypothetical protein